MIISYHSYVFIYLFIYLLIYLFIYFYFHNNEIDNDMYILKSLLLCLWKLCSANTCKLKMVL